MEDPLYQHTYYATHPDMMDGVTNEELRDRYRVPGLFEPGKITLVYSHGERFVIGGAVPGAAPLALPTQAEPENVAGRPLLERRELAVVNIGAGRGTILVDGQQVELDKYDALYVPMGSKDVQFAGEGARFYLLSVPAHIALPMRKMRAADVVPMERGSAEQSNRRTIYQLILPHTCQSASLCLGLTKLDSGSVWNTMPPHVHERRSEIYLYFDLEEDNRVFHYMGKPDALRHIVLENEEVVLSPPWSVHMGSGTSNYSFIWAMAGENLDYNDMDVIDICQLR